MAGHIVTVVTQIYTGTNISVDLETEGKNSSSQWVNILPKIVTKINQKVKESNIKPDDIHNNIPDISYNPEHKIDLLSVGQDVRVALDKPQDNILLTLYFLLLLLLCCC